MGEFQIGELVKIVRGKKYVEIPPYLGFPLGHVPQNCGKFAVVSFAKNFNGFVLYDVRLFVDGGLTRSYLGIFLEKIENLK